MANPGTNIPYDALSTDDLPPGTPTYGDVLMPPGAQPPRFYGSAAAGTAGSRASYVSSDSGFPQQVHGYRDDSPGDSVQALNIPTASSRATMNPFTDDPRALPPTPPMAHQASYGGSSSYPLTEKHALYSSPRDKRRLRFIAMGAGCLGLILILVAVVIPVYFTVIKPKNTAANDSSPGSSGPSAPKPSSTGSSGLKSTGATTGGDGSVVTDDNGNTFLYNNPFGGYWVFDPADPFNNDARAQSTTPALNETWQFGINKIHGVDIGGWLVTEPFITPALFEPYQNGTPQAVDEWTLSQRMAADTANGGLAQLETHYNTFITEEDFAQIAGSGLNWVRIPIPCWAIEVRDDEPFLAKTSWTYFLKAIKWARKYGLRIAADLHAVPGSQNGWNHSGRVGAVNWMNGPMGFANAQRTLTYIRSLAEFFAQPQYLPVIPMFGVVNEPDMTTIGQTNLVSFYVQAYDILRSVGGVGEGNGQMMAIHDAFEITVWPGVLPDADRLALDTHPYYAFGTQSGDLAGMVQSPCNDFGPMINTSMTSFGFTSAGEFSNAINDCGYWVNAVGAGSRYEGTFDGATAIGSCDPWNDWQAWNETTKSELMQFAMASMDSLQNWFFWTWKIGNSTVLGTVGAPFWSYQLGLQYGWMPTDPNSASGTCADTNPFVPPLQPWQTGGVGANDIPAAVLASYPFPPPTFSPGLAAAAMPTYTPTGAAITMPVPTFTNGASTINAGDGWFNAQDNTLAYVEIPGCTYPEAWDALSSTAVACVAAAAKRAPEPMPTPPQF